MSDGHTRQESDTAEEAVRARNADEVARAVLAKIDERTKHMEEMLDDLNSEGLPQRVGHVEETVRRLMVGFVLAMGASVFGLFQALS